MEESEEMRLFEQIERCLSQDTPVESLRQFVIDVNNNGISKEEILKELNEFDDLLINSGRLRERDNLEDVLDMMTGSYGGYNLDLK